MEYGYIKEHSRLTRRYCDEEGSGAVTTYILRFLILGFGTLAVHILQEQNCEFKYRLKKFTPFIQKCCFIYWLKMTYCHFSYRFLSEMQLTVHQHVACLKCEKYAFRCKVKWVIIHYVKKKRVGFFRHSYTQYKNLPFEGDAVINYSHDSLMTVGTSRTILT